jgi:hypothetical protein
MKMGMFGIPEMIKNSPWSFQPHFSAISSVKKIIPFQDASFVLFNILCFSNL